MLCLQKIFVRIVDIFYYVSYITQWVTPSQQESKCLTTNRLTTEFVCRLQGFYSNAIHILSCLDRNSWIYDLLIDKLYVKKRNRFHDQCNNKQRTWSQHLSKYSTTNVGCCRLCARLSHVIKLAKRGGSIKFLRGCKNAFYLKYFL